MLNLQYIIYKKDNTSKPCGILVMQGWFNFQNQFSVINNATKIKLKKNIFPVDAEKVLTKFNTDS